MSTVNTQNPLEDSIANLQTKLPSEVDNKCWNCEITVLCIFFLCKWIRVNRWDEENVSTLLVQFLVHGHCSFIAALVASFQEAIGPSLETPIIYIQLLFRVHWEEQYLAITVHLLVNLLSTEKISRIS